MFARVAVKLEFISIYGNVAKATIARRYPVTLADSESESQCFLPRQGS
jgi:hypothetical protein